MQNVDKSDPNTFMKTILKTDHAGCVNTLEENIFILYISDIDNPTKW